MTAATSFARQSLLLVLCGGAIGVLGNAMINSPKQSSLREPVAFNFPQNVTLPDASISAAKPLAAKDKVGAGQSYRYTTPPLPSSSTSKSTAGKPQVIDLEIRYITDGVANRPTMDAMLPVFNNVPAKVLAPSTMKEQPGLGFYSLFVDKKTAYFGTCINPQGITTVTGDQFHANSNPKGVPFQRLVPWVLGQQTLRDSRCLWTVLSTPIDEAAPDATIKTLQTVGINWARWWQGNFPPA
ncbi:cyanoexosortase A system-associated protein [Chamaesiphon sp. VAR_48_metabat_403]|uniref:cyanoexosortase A system-associated protein n=1 Tax=Chamaesiphon sp. VAR_48_metabat_403 TaxID=2964700 RepID=UPI00286D6C17|nr:cyanoexosortase A system-associated protein [Chamaesiphon sp. VAR_48_metabat_403]